MECRSATVPGQITCRIRCGYHRAVHSRQQPNYTQLLLKISGADPRVRAYAAVASRNPLRHRPLRPYIATFGYAHARTHCVLCCGISVAASSMHLSSVCERRWRIARPMQHPEESLMRPWQSIAIALAAAPTLSAYADDRTSTTSQSSATSAAGGSMGTTAEGQRGTTGMSTGGTTSTTSGQHGMDHSRMDSATAAEMKNISTEKFFEKAAAAGMKEVQAAELALKNAQSDQVKSFARKMITDHTKQNSRLTTMAAQNNVKLQQELPAKDKAEIEKLRNAKGATFDTAYAQAMEKDHQKAVALFQGCADSGKVANDVKSFCRESIATLQQHLQAANALDSGTSRAASTDE